jgi:hypothetical protein
MQHNGHGTATLDTATYWIWHSIGHETSLDNIGLNAAQYWKQHSTPMDTAQHKISTYGKPQFGIAQYTRTHLLLVLVAPETIDLGITVFTQITLQL